jgi:hypothetical protein
MSGGNHPHGHDLDDSLINLQALAAFAEEHGDLFERIEGVRNVGDVIEVLISG